MIYLSGWCGLLVAFGFLIIPVRTDAAVKSDLIYRPTEITFLHCVGFKCAIIYIGVPKVKI